MEGHVDLFPPLISTCSVDGKLRFISIRILWYNFVGNYKFQFMHVYSLLSSYHMTSVFQLFLSANLIDLVKGKVLQMLKGCS
jgi:hypothetical protein